jgi:hypothetical protein
MQYKLSKEEWESIGINAGWMKTAGPGGRFQASLSSAEQKLWANLNQQQKNNYAALDAANRAKVAALPLQQAQQYLNSIMPPAGGKVPTASSEHNVKTALKLNEDTDEKTPEQYKKEFIERMKSIGMTDEEIERAIQSGYLERIMKGNKGKK